jgi:hypothetical protein
MLWWWWRCCITLLLCEPVSPHLQVSGSYTITDTQPQPVGLLYMSDQPVAEAATYTTHNKRDRKTNHDVNGIRTCNPSNQADADLRRIPQGHRDRPSYPTLKVAVFRTEHIHSVFCLTTGPMPLPKRFLRIVRSRASSFKWEYPLLSLRSSNSFVRLYAEFYDEINFGYLMHLVGCSIRSLKRCTVTWTWKTERRFNTSEVTHICMLQKHCSELCNTKDISTSHVRIFTSILNIIFLLTSNTKFLTIGSHTLYHHKEETYPKPQPRNVC